MFSNQSKATRVHSVLELKTQLQEYKVLQWTVTRTEYSQVEKKKNTIHDPLFFGGKYSDRDTVFLRKKKKHDWDTVFLE